MRGAWSWEEQSQFSKDRKMTDNSEEEATVTATNVVNLVSAVFALWTCMRVVLYDRIPSHGAITQSPPGFQ